jgi:DNA-binding transcriptional LysR family regulator
MTHKGDLRGNIDDILEMRGLTRRVVLAAPTFLLALSAVAESDLLFAGAELPVRAQAKRFSLVTAPLPIPLPGDEIRTIVPRAALEDAGIAWLIDEVIRAIAPESAPRRRNR